MDSIEDISKQCRPLMDVLSEIPDFRRAKGKRYSLSSILALALWQCFVDIEATEPSQTGEATMVRNS